MRWGSPCQLFSVSGLPFKNAKPTQKQFGCRLGHRFGEKVIEMIVQNAKVTMTEMLRHSMVEKIGSTAT